MDKHILIQEITDNLPQISSEIIQKVGVSQLSTYTNFSSEQLLALGTMVLQAFLHDLRDEQGTAFATHWKRTAEIRAQQGGQIKDLLYLLSFSHDIIHERVQKRFGNFPDVQIWWLERSQQIMFSAMITLAQVFVEVREHVIQEQAEQIRELSTPIIPLHENILALPLVGTISASRIGQILETLLNGINAHQAEVIIIDITGVPVVDTNVAHYLLQASRAAQLLGAQVVIVGISPEVAQTITQLGVDLSTIKTRSNMQSGIEYALSQLGLRIRRT